MDRCPCLEAGLETYDPMTATLVPHPSVAVVFATMNRWKTAAACVAALAAQTRSPELVIVADNASTDETVSQLRALQDLPFELIVQSLEENIGNAGGVEAAMELAFSKGMEAVWILDDDSWPRPEALEALLSEPWDPDVVRHAIQIDPDTKKLSWPMWVEPENGWKLVFEAADLPSGALIPSKSSWTGALISKQVRHKVGPVLGALFIRGEDEEYPWRIAEAGFHFAACPTAIMDHPGAVGIHHWRLLGKHFFMETKLSDWKLYYKVRNMVWLKRSQSGNCSAVAVGTAYLLATLWMEGPKRLSLVTSAARDGWNAKLGKWKFHPSA